VVKKMGKMIESFAGEVTEHWRGYSIGAWGRFGFEQRDSMFYFIDGSKLKGWSARRGFSVEFIDKSGDLGGVIGGS